jgi:uncharacterized membrane protein
MLIIFIKFILCVIAVEAISELLVNADVFQGIHKYLFDKKHNKICKFLHELLDCVYCTSVWVSFFILVLIYKQLAITDFLLFFLSWMVMHRLATLMHYVINRVKDITDI